MQEVSSRAKIFSSHFHLHFSWKGIVERETLWSMTSRGWYGKRQLDMLSTSNRKFSKVSMKSLNHLDNKMADAFAKHGPNIRQLDLSNTILSNRAMWCQGKLLNSLLKSEFSWIFFVHSAHEAADAEDIEAR